MTTKPESVDVPGTYRELLAKANLSPDELARLSRLEPWRPTIDLARTLILLLAAPHLFAYQPGVITGVVCLVVVLHAFNCFASMVHASDHGYLYENPTVNNAAGNLCAAIVGYTRAGHKLAHNAHHIHLNTDGDTDKVWGDPADSMLHVARKWIEDLLGVSAIRRLLQYSQSDRKTFTVTPWRRLNMAFFVQAARLQALVIPVQLILLAYFWWIAGPTYYAVFHVLPLITLYPALIRLRTTVEHSFPVGYRPTDTQSRWMTRSTSSSWLERFVIAPLDGHFHFEHHLLPGVPYYKLRASHALLESKGFRVPMAPGYFAFVLQKWRAEKALAPSGA